MNPMVDLCHDDRARRAALRAGDLNGLDYLEVDENDRHRLTVVMIAKLRGLGQRLTAANFVVKGGRRVQHITVTSVTVCERRDPDLDDCLTLTLDHIGDFSTYTLCIVEADGSRPTDRPHPEIDPRYACLEFSFQAGCSAHVDCAETTACPEPARERPAIDYLAKDFASFKRLMFDRLALLVPDWTERHEPDLLVALVEVLAYEGDRLSYLQDAVSTEAYLGTARQRISVRRHARLVDYRLHEGCNARAWVHVHVEQDSLPLLPDDFYFITRYPGSKDDGAALSGDDLRDVPADEYEVFEPVRLPAAAAGVHRRRVAHAADLCRRVLHGSDAIDRFVRDRLPADVLARLRDHDEKAEPPADLVEALLGELERIAREHSLAFEKAFTSLPAGRRLRAMFQKPFRGPELIRVNRLLMEAAFEKQLVPDGTTQFYKDHNLIPLYTWGELDCCLPRGATSATLLDTARRLRFAPGDFLLFEEVRGPVTGDEADADPTHRHVVRLTEVKAIVDPVFKVPLLDVRWGREDALPFPLCLSARGQAPDCKWLEELSVARGNVLIVDHGRRLIEELDAVEAESLDQPCDGCNPEHELRPRPYAPVLDRPDLTFAQPPAPLCAAARALTQDPSDALPSIRLQQVSLQPPVLESPDPLDRYRNPVPLTVFERDDLLSPAALANRLENAGAADPIAVYVRSKLDAAAETALKVYAYPSEPGTALTRGMLAALNAGLDDAGLFDPARFPDASHDPSTDALMRARPLPDDLARTLNRWLLEQAFPEALSPSRRLVRDWQPRFDLLASSGDDCHFVVEMSDDRRAFLRFGDDALGEQPDASTRFRAYYRVGNAAAGNVGAEAISHFVLRSGSAPEMIVRPRNPLPAAGGVEPESTDTARRRAPHAIRRARVRAVTADDYADLAARHHAVDLQGAAADLVWTGSWHEARVMLDPFGREEPARRLLERVRDDLEQYRRMGHDLRLSDTQYVPLSITLRVCVKPDHQQAHVRTALIDVFSPRLRADGTPGFFHPDNLRFATSVDVSQIVAQAQRVPGVVWSRVSKLERLGEGDAGELEAGTLSLARNEIARVGSSVGVTARPGFPELGSLTLEMEGGR